MAERKHQDGRLVKRTVETFAVAGLPLASRVVEEFDFKELPEVVRRSLTKSKVPEVLYPDALAVIGRAYGRVLNNWSSENVGDTPDLAWRTPSVDDFDACIENLKANEVGVETLVGLSDRLFGRADTPAEIFLSMKNELDNIFNPPGEDQ